MLRDKGNEIEGMEDANQLTLNKGNYPGLCTWA